jgi:AcrR family transcriptional regulator
MMASEIKMTTPPDPSSQLSRKEREQALHRQDILDVAVKLFAVNGYHQTTMQMIADQAEFSVGYLYKHFSGKEEMYQEMVRFHLAKIDALDEGVAELGLAPLDELFQNFKGVCEHFNHHQDFMRIFHEGVGGEFCELKEGKKRHCEEIADLLQAALDAGHLKPCEPALVAAAMQGATKELFHELAKRDIENPFSPMPDLVFGLLIDPLRIQQP